MSKSFYAVIVAGGSGTRMGAQVPKQFIELDGKPILRHTIERFTKAVPEAKIITVLPSAHIPYWREYCTLHNFTQPQTIVEGGITRFHSVRNALQRVPDGAIVAIHDGVRPFVSEQLIRDMHFLMYSNQALIPVLPCVDTLVVLDKSEGGSLIDTADAPLDRSRVYGVQTPQMFLSEQIKSAYEQPYSTSFTDDGSVARSAKIPLSYIEGERHNIKITTPQDLELARALLLQSTPEE